MEKIVDMRKDVVDQAFEEVRRGFQRIACKYGVDERAFKAPENRQGQRPVILLEHKP